MSNALSTSILVSTALFVFACDARPADQQAESEPARAPAPSEAQPTDDKAPSPASAEPTRAKSDQPSVDQSHAGLSEGEHFFVEITPDPNPIPFQELFTLELRVLDPSDKETLLADVQVDQVRATMPAHKHGMKVKPSITARGDGTFLVEGMKFHMQGPREHGRWVIEAVLNDGERVDKVSYAVQCCE